MKIWNMQTLIYNHVIANWIFYGITVYYGTFGIENETFVIDW